MRPSRQMIILVCVFAFALLALIPGLTSAQQGAASVASIKPQNLALNAGVVAFLVDQDAAPVTAAIRQLGVSWLKQVIEWRGFEPVKGEIDFTSLDTAIEAAHNQGLRILLTVSTAPDWARSSTSEDGPPDNYADYGVFVGALAQRYAGKVQAYEIWSEPNLRREWNSAVHPLGASSYLELLRVGYAAIKQADPAAIVVSAGLAPTGFNDSINALNDRDYLRDMYTSGLASASDAIGAHPKGWANPPDALCCIPPVGVETHYEHPSFYFLNTLNDYRQIMQDNGDSSTQIWVTDFGWGTSEDTAPPSSMHVFVSYTDLDEQAMYVPRGFELGQELGFVGPMFLDNLNGCQANQRAVDSCYYSLIGPDGAPRPVFAAVANLLLAGAATSQSAPVDQSLQPTMSPELSPEVTAESPAPSG